MPEARLRLILSERCNLTCTYCHFRASHGQGGIMTAETALHAVRSFYDYQKRSGTGRADLSLYGGEPLLNPRAFSALLTECARLRDNGFFYRLILNTNGTRITPDLSRSLATAGAAVHLSLDGPDESSNRNRHYASGRSSLQEATRGLDLLIQAGVQVQINSVFQPEDVESLGSLARFAVCRGVHRLFAALPDGQDEAFDTEDLAAHLLEIRGAASASGLFLFGPWSTGLGARLAARDWPPMNMVVTPTGEWFFPQNPHRKAASMQEAFADEEGRDGWKEIVTGCEGCEIEDRCHGYLKLMSRYHTGQVRSADRQCALARTVARLSHEERFAPVRTTVDLNLIVNDGVVRIAHDLFEDSAIEGAEDLLPFLGYFNEGGTLSGMQRRFSGTDLTGAFQMLVDRRILVQPDQDTDVLLFQRLPGNAFSANTITSQSELRSESLQQKDGPFRVKASESVAPILEDLLPLLLDGRQRLPLRLRHASPIFLALLDGPEFAQYVNGGGWMVGTVFHSVILLDGEVCASIFRHGGHNRMELFRCGLMHEMIHIALRLAGFRLPIWLEEGICEYLSAKTFEPADIRRAYRERPRFIAFARDAMRTGNGRVGLLSFSGEPVDTNPGYILAREFIAWMDRETGLDSFLDSIEVVGGWADPAGLLTSWCEQVQGPPAISVPDPFRVVRDNGKVLLYNRLFGGYAIFPDDGSLPDDRNLSGAEPGFPDGHLLTGLRNDFRSTEGLHLRLSLAEKCNMACSYCYTEPTENPSMSMEVALRAVAAFRDLLLSRHFGHSSIRLFGGEPFLNWPVMERVLLEADQGLPPGALRWIINTNGTCIRDEHIDVLKAKGERLSIELSLDGVGDVHDQCRRFRGGGATFAAADRGAKRIAMAGIPLCISTVLGSHNVSGLRDLADYAVSLRQSTGARVSLWIEPLISAQGEGNAEAAMDHTLAAFEDLLCYCDRIGLPASGKMLMAHRAMMDGATGHFCSVTGLELSVGADGRLVVCHAIPNSAYGDIAQVKESIPLPDEVRYRAAGNLAYCKGCEVEGLCGGGCLASSHLRTGSIYGSPGSDFCRWMRGGFLYGAKQTLHSFRGHRRSSEHG